jgi:hypothetical protein
MSRSQEPLAFLWFSEVTPAGVGSRGRRAGSSEALGEQSPADLRRRGSRGDGERGGLKRHIAASPTHRQEDAVSGGFWRFGFLIALLIREVDSVVRNLAAEEQWGYRQRCAICCGLVLGCGLAVGGDGVSLTS